MHAVKTTVVISSEFCFPRWRKKSEKEQQILLQAMSAEILHLRTVCTVYYFVTSLSSILLEEWKNKHMFTAASWNQIHMRAPFNLLHY